MRRRSITRVLPAALAPALALTAFVAGGCSGPTVWEQSFARSPDALPAPALPAEAPVAVRGLPWERMQGALADLDREYAAGDVPPGEWPAERRAAVKERLLRALQVTAPPGSVDVVGRCEFRTTDTIRPDAGDAGVLERFARSVGADSVVWSSRVLGRTEKIVDRPVTTLGTTTYWGPRRGPDRWWSDSWTENTTTWVPVRVPADETGFVAFFLRSRGM